MIAALLSVSMPQGWARITSSGYSLDANHSVFEHAEYEYYFNNSGAALTSGTGVIFDTTGTGVNLNVDTIRGANGSAAKSLVPRSETDQTTIGTYITTTTTADSPLAAGIVDDNSIANQTYGVVQIFGPRVCIWQDSTDAVTSGSAVGTTTPAGRIGGGNGMGVALEAGTGANGSLGWILIRPGGNN